jgi:hypothetical protein
MKQTETDLWARRVERAKWVRLRNQNKETDEETTKQIARVTIYIRIIKVRFWTLNLSLLRAKPCAAAGWKWCPRTPEFNSLLPRSKDVVVKFEWKAAVQHETSARWKHTMRLIWRVGQLFRPNPPALPLWISRQLYLCGWFSSKRTHEVKMDSKEIVNKVHHVDHMWSKQAENVAQLKLMKSQKQGEGHRGRQQL